MLVYTYLVVSTFIILSSAFNLYTQIPQIRSLPSIRQQSTQLLINRDDTNTKSSSAILKPIEDEIEVKQTFDYYIELTNENSFDGMKPDSSWVLAFVNFRRQLGHIFNQGLEQVGVKKVEPHRPPKCLNLVLSNQAVKETEERRVNRGEIVDVHPVAKALYDLGCLFLDELFEDRPIQRFWFLETVARIPYFSYVSMLHLYESLGQYLFQ